MDTNDLSKHAALTEEIIRRVVRRYQEKLLADDYHRKALEQVLADLPRIVQDCLSEARKNRF